MRQPAKRTSEESGQKQTKLDWSIGLQLMDTTWRVALPIIIFTWGGIQLDKHQGSTPLFTLIGLLVSLVLATLLVYKQIKDLYPDFFKGGKK